MLVRAQRYRRYVRGLDPALGKRSQRRGRVQRHKKRQPQKLTGKDSKEHLGLARRDRAATQEWAEGVGGDERRRTKRPVLIPFQSFVDARGWATGVRNVSSTGDEEERRFERDPFRSPLSPPILGRVEKQEGTRRGVEGRAWVDRRGLWSSGTKPGVSILSFAAPFRARELGSIRSEGFGRVTVEGSLCFANNASGRCPSNDNNDLTH